MAQQQKSGRYHRLRTGLILAVTLVAVALLLTRCPANRDGMPGQLAQAMDETTAAARTGALALSEWGDHRASRQLTSVALSDSRDQAVKAYKGIAKLRAEDPVDLGRQRMLTESMTVIIDQLNAASACVRDVTAQPDVRRARDDLLASAQSLESRYR
jgi:hypothetical protein